MPDDVARLDSALLPDLARHLRALVAAGELELEAAEAILEAAIEAAALDEPGQVTARRIEQIESQAARLIILAGAEKLTQLALDRLKQSGQEIEQFKPEKSDDPIREILRIYTWGPAEQRAIEEQIRRTRYDAYQAKLAELAEAVGCPGAAGRAQGPGGGSRSELDRQSRTDAESIIATWNREARAQIERLVAAKPDGDAKYYRAEMEAWANSRDRWKQAQIALMSAQTARNLAREDFYAQNSALLGQPRFRFAGPPPREAECARLMALGAVEADVVKANPTPIHINCPHEWEAMQGPGAVDCPKLWVG